MNISHLDKAVVLAALYNQAHVQGLGILHAKPGDMSIEEARALLADQTYFDYLHGRVMKIDLSEDDLSTTLYNRDNGPNAAESIISALS